MSTKNSKIAALFVVAMISIYSTCSKQNLAGCAETTYNFKIGVKIYPDKDIINIGDTVWLEVSTPVNLPDLNSNQIIDYSSAENLGSAIGFGKFNGTDSIAEAANLFNYSLQAGKEVFNPFVTKIREYLFVQQGMNYIFKLGVVPTQRGIFGIGISNAGNVYRVFDKCTKASFAVVVENSRQHYYLNPNINPSNFDTTKPSGTYYFKVN